MKPQRLLLSWLLALSCIGQAGAQVRSILSWPDRVMSGGRIGRVSARESLSLPVWDTAAVAFAPPGSRSVTEDYPFVTYLFENGLNRDALTLLSGSYLPSDTLSWLRGRVLFAERNPGMAARCFSQVGPASGFAAAARSYRVVSLAYMGDYAGALAALPQALPGKDLASGEPGAVGPGETAYAELAALQGAGLGLLTRREAVWETCRKAFTFQDYRLAESERVLEEIGRARFGGRQKSPWLAALLSAGLPGAGKVYAGRPGEGVAAFLTVGSLAAITGEQYRRSGKDFWRTWVPGLLCATFYLGNIYGSYLSVSVEQERQTEQADALVLYHLHIPLRSFFR